MAALDLYKGLILEHSKKPFRFEKKIENRTAIQAYNPLCGDKYTLFLDPSKSDRLDLYFYGYGCALSKASASVMITQLQGMSIQEAINHMNIFQELLDPASALPHLETISDDFKAFLPARNHPARLSCVTLVWDSLEKYLMEGD